MDNKVFSYYKELPSWAKGVVAIGGIGIAFYIGYTLIRRIKSQAETIKMRETVVTQETELKDKLDTGMKLTYGESQYKGWANQLAVEFAGCDPFNASFGILINILYALKNDADFLKLCTSYDVRSHDQCGVWNGDFKGNLYEAVKDEFNNDDIIKLNKALRLQKITYQF